MKKLKKAGIALAVLFVILLGLAALSLIRLQIKTREIDDDFSGVYTDEKYRAPVFVEGVGVIEQDVSCGYAVIEMFSAWSGGGVTEESLYRQYGRVVTSTGKAFCEEMNKQFPAYTTGMHKYLRNTELIDLAYDSLSRGTPVPFEWAALYGEEWTLHYSLLVGMDIPADRITVANPYGYYEELSVDEFLARTRFDAYEKMPLFLKLGFAFGIFEKNTVFIVR